MKEKEDVDKIVEKIFDEEIEWDCGDLEPYPSSSIDSDTVRNAIKKAYLLGKESSKPSLNNDFKSPSAKDCFNADRLIEIAKNVNDKEAIYLKGLLERRNPS